MSYVRRINARPEHSTFECEFHIAGSDCPYSSYAEPLDLDRGHGFDEIGSALCADCICDSNGNGFASRHSIEVVPIQEDSGASPDVRCESIGCGRHATKNVVVSFRGKPEYGSTACDLHADSIAMEIWNA